MKGWFGDEMRRRLFERGCSVAICSVQAEETEKCPLTLTQSPNNEPLILFLIDVKSLRCVCFSAPVWQSFYFSALKSMMWRSVINVLVCLCSVNVRVLGEQDNVLIAKLKAETASPKDKGQWHLLLPFSVIFKHQNVIVIYFRFITLKYIIFKIREIRNLVFKAKDHDSSPVACVL